MPDSIAFIVFLPMISLILVSDFIEILGSLAAAKYRASKDKFTPGAITPPL